MSDDGGRRAEAAPAGESDSTSDAVFVHRPIDDLIVTADSLEQPVVLPPADPQDDEVRISADLANSSGLEELTGGVPRVLDFQITLPTTPGAPPLVQALQDAARPDAPSITLDEAPAAAPAPSVPTIPSSVNAVLGDVVVDVVEIPVERNPIQNQLTTYAHDAILSDSLKDQALRLTRRRRRIRRVKRFIALLVLGGGIAAAVVYGRPYVEERFGDEPTPTTVVGSTTDSPTVTTIAD